MRRFLHLAFSLVALLMISMNANAWKFTVNSPAEGEVTELYQIVLDEPAGTMWVDEFGAMPCTLACSDGTTYTYNMGDNFQAQVAGTPVGSAEITAPGTYTLTIPAGTFHISGEANEEQTFTWTIGGGQGGGETQNYPFEFAYDKANEGRLTLTWPEGSSVSIDALASYYIDGTTGSINLMPANSTGDIFGSTNQLWGYITLPDGEYTFVANAGSFVVDGVPCEAISYKFTVGEGTEGGGGSTGDFDGEVWQETFFKSGETTIDKNNIMIETDGAIMTTVDGEFNLGGSLTTIPFGYNTYGEKELDWNNKCQLIFTAKDNISGIVMEGNSDIGSASADKGRYINGVWTGALMKGETLTLTASIGITLSKITILYNGAEYEEEIIENEEGEITVTWPVANQVIASIAQGGKLCEFTTNKDYAIVTIALKNNNTLYTSHDLQVRMYDGQVIGEGVAKDITHTVTTAVPNEKSFSLFNGDSYTMVITGFVNMWDVPENYDCQVEIPIVGGGQEHEVLSNVKLVKMTPEGTPVNPGELSITNGKITLEFDGPVSSVKAVNARGMEGSTTYNGTVKAGSDNKIWEVVLGDLSSLASSETESAIFNLAFTAKDAENHTIVFDETKFDYCLEASWKLVQGTPAPVKSLGTPVFSIANQSEIEAAATMPVTIQFPNAEGYEGMGFMVYGQLFDMNMNFSNVAAADDNFGIFGELAATMMISTEAGNSYSLAITKVEIYDMNTATLVETLDNLSYNVNFTTKAGAIAQATLGEAVIAADETGLTISWPNADQSLLSIAEGEVKFPSSIIIVTGGTEYEVYPEAIALPCEKAEVNIPYEKIAVYDPSIGEFGSMVPVKLANGQEITVQIAQNGIEVVDYSKSFFGDVVYTNAEAINLTTNAVVEEVAEPAQPYFTINEEKVELNEETPVEIEKLPNGTTFSYFDLTEGINHITWQIEDVANEASIKSIADLVKGENGEWKGEILRDIELPAGQEFKVIVISRSSVSNFSTTNILARHEYTIIGTADVATYSDVNFVSITPNTDDIIKEAPVTVTLTFDAPLESVTVGYNRGQMDYVELGPCTPNADKTQWSYVLTEDFLNGSNGAVSLRFVAVDAKGNRVVEDRTAGEDPATADLTFSYATIFGLPTPELVQNGKTYDSPVGILQFKYEGIGLNQDAATASWNQIQIAYNGQPLDIAIIEEMFAVVGDESVGGTQINMVLAEPLKLNGTYTVTLPALAFMLGHDQLNNYSGAAVYSFTIDGVEEEVNELEIIPELVLVEGEDGAALNSHSEVSVESASMLNVEFINGAGVASAKYVLSSVIGQIEKEATVWVPNEVLSEGDLSISGKGSAVFAEPIQFIKGEKYQLVVTVTMMDGTVQDFKFIFNGATAVPVIAEVGLIVSGEEEEVTLNDHSIVSAEKVDGVKVQFGTPAVVATASYKICEVVPNTDEVVETVAEGEVSINTYGFVEFSAPVYLVQGKQYKIIIVAMDGNNSELAQSSFVVNGATEPWVVSIARVAALNSNGENVIYTLSGARINAAQMQKGNVYIVNGKKLLVK